MSTPSAAVPVAATLTTFMAFDYGEKRTGVAVGNRLLGTAQPQGSIHAQGDARFVQIEKVLKEWQPQAIVIGVPYHPDGAAHENTIAQAQAGHDAAILLRDCERHGLALVQKFRILQRRRPHIVRALDLPRRGIALEIYEEGVEAPQ